MAVHPNGESITEGAETPVGISNSSQGECSSVAHTPMQYTTEQRLTTGTVALKNPSAQSALTLSIFLEFNIITSWKMLIIFSQVFLIYTVGEEKKR